MRSANKNPAEEKTKTKHKQPDNAMFRLIGIGSSAGGLEALRIVMESLPASDILSYVITQHVSPNYESMLGDLLASSTPLQIKKLKDKTRPETGIIYITPPNKDVVFEDGILRLYPPKEGVGPKPSISRFFTSMADALGELAIGIVLSGTGTDGSAGVRAINGAGGITIAQKPETAKYDGMPKAAIHTGKIDFILEPEKIGPALERLSIGGDFAEIDGEIQDSDEYARISALMRKYAAFNLDDYKSATVKRRITRRMSIVRAAGLPEYFDYLKENRDEAQNLMQDIFIGVTDFFRDTDAFAAFEQIISECVNRHDANYVIRCWIPGCSTGEEVYSIAMMFEEALRKRKKIGPQYLIFASDIDGNAVERARAGLYLRSDLGNLTAELRERYTEVISDHCQIISNIRKRIVFTRQNLIEDPPFSRLDLISCRNLMIYFTPIVQKRVLSLFHYALNPGGLLFLGKSETVDQQNDLFKPVDNRMRIYQAREGVSRHSPMTVGYSYIHSPKTAGREVISTDLITNRTLEGLVEQYAPPSLVINSDDNIIHIQGNLNPFLAFPSGQAGMHLFDLVNSALRAELRALVYRCRREMQSAKGHIASFDIDGKPHRLNMRVSLLEPGEKSLLLVSFITAQGQDTPRQTGDSTSEQDYLLINALEQELGNTRDHLNVMVEELEGSNEELQSLNEELQSANEELRSTNEEMQTSNEELQSTNEELLTVNEELQVRTAELEDTTRDLLNVKQSLTHPLLVVDLTLCVTQINNACGEIIDLSHLVLGHSLNSLPWKIEVAGLSVDIQRVMADNKPCRKVINSPNTPKVYELHIMPYRHELETVTGAVLLFEDITAQRGAEEALKLSNERFQVAVDGSSDGLWDWDIVADKFYWSPRFKEIIGYRDDEIDAVYDSWESRLHPKDKTATLDALKACVENDTPYDVEYRLKHRSGAYLWIRARGRVVTRDDKGNATRMAGSMSDITQRKEAEIALRESESKYRQVTEALPQLVWTCAPDGPCDYLSPQWVEYTGISEAEQLGYGWLDQLHPDDRRRTVDHWMETAAKGHPFEIDFRIRRHDGAYRWFHTLARPVKDEAGNIIKWFGSNTDIDDQKHSEAGLRKSEEQFRDFVENTPIPIALFDREMNYLSMSRGWRETFEHSENMIGRCHYDIHPDLPEEWKAVHQRGLAGETIEDRESRWDRADGSVVWYHWLVNPWKDISGNIQGIIISFFDQTKRVEIESALRESEQRFRLMTDNIKDYAIFMLDTEGRVITWNLGAQKLKGYSAGEIIGQPMSVFYPQAEIEAGKPEKLLQQAQQAGSVEDEGWRIRKDGSRFYADVILTAIRNPAGGLEGFAKITRDITNRKEMEKQLAAHREHLETLVEEKTQALTKSMEEAKRANQAKSEFLSSMSHELRTPMNAILGFGQLLLMRDEGIADYSKGYVAEILKAGNHLLALINDVLDLAKIESGKLEVFLEPVDLNALTSECADLMAPSAGAQGIKLAMAMDKHLVVQADKIRLKQVFLNLLSNAVKYNKKDGSILIECRKADNASAVVNFIDSGVGIAKEKLSHLFKPFNRLGHENSNIEGTGIGLSLSSKIIESMGGRIAVESTPGVGSTFSLTLPLEKQTGAGLPAGNEDATDMPVQIDQDGRKDSHVVLYIEDNPSNLILVEKILENHGNIKFIAAHTPQLGIELARNHLPGLILLDINLPEMGGYEVLDIFKNDEKLRDIPVVAVTANAMTADIEKAKQSRFDDYLTKPLDLNAFNAMINRFLFEPD